MARAQTKVKQPAAIQGSGSPIWMTLEPRGKPSGGDWQWQISRPRKPLPQSSPKIDLEINFDYNSADISAKSLPSVQALGRALTNNDLKGSTFVVAGHTDAAGGETYNQDLSERRADAIKRYLVDKYGINGTDLVTVGYGKSKLKDPSQPMAEVNRRVQVVAWRRPIVSGYNTSRSPRAGRIRFWAPLQAFGRPNAPCLI